MYRPPAIARSALAATVIPLLLASCSLGGGRSAEGARTAATKTYTDESLATVLGKAPAVAGYRPTPDGSSDLATERQARSAVAVGASLGSVTPAECGPRLTRVLEGYASDGALAVGDYGDARVELHAFPTADDARGLVTALGEATSACGSFEVSALGRRAKGSMAKVDVGAAEADASSSARMSFALDTDPSEKVRASAAVGNVVATVLAPKGTPDRDTKTLLDGLVTATQADLGHR